MSLRRVLSADLTVHLTGHSHADNVRNDGATVTYNGSYADGNFGRMCFRHDGTDDTADAGDVGNIRTVAFWVKPTTTTEELILLDTGKDIMVNAGTITYTGLTADQTYVNGDISTTLVAGEWQHVVCVLNAATDANTFKTATDGTNFGACDMADVRGYASYDLQGDEVASLYQHSQLVA